MLLIAVCEAAVYVAAVLMFSMLQVGTKVGTASHSQRSVALSPRASKLSFGYVMNPSRLVRTTRKGERQTRPNDCHSSL